ncbi:MAG: PH domain-containing protein, partial [Planctomycetota bacterium]
SLLFLIGGAALAVTMAFMVPCRYTILSDTLSIRCGIIFYQVPLADIEQATKSATLWSGPALSLKRVEIKTAKRTFIVSPKDRDDFIAKLLAAKRDVTQSAEASSENS